MRIAHTHIPVLLPEVIANLAVHPEGCYIDATFGRGGHSQAILAQLGVSGKLVVIDKDPQALQHAMSILGNDSRVTIAQGSFAQLRQIASQYELIGKVNGLLMDLGVSSPQLDDPQRGFSFLQDGPLDMRMDPNSKLDAATWINTAKEALIADVFKEYGEERFARRIARAIAKERKLQAIQTTGRLAAIIAAANPAWEKHKHPATRCFQAIRIFINNELNELQSCLEQSLDVLAIGGRLLVISFHSLEDRIVKQFIRRYEKNTALPRDLPLMQHQLGQRLRSIGRAIKPGALEIAENPRSRSAVLRVAEKLS